MTANELHSSEGFTASRLPLLPEEAARRALEDAGVPRMISNLNISKAIANSPLLTRVVTQPTALLMAGSALAPRLRELIILRVAWLNRCEYEWAQHYRFSRATGLNDEEIEAVRNWREADVFEEAARCVLELTDALAARQAVSDELWRRLVDALGGEVEAVEAAAVAGAWTMVAYVLKAAAVPLEGNQAPWPPDGREPDTSTS